MTLKRTFLASLMAGCLAGSTAWAQPPAPGSPDWDRFRSIDSEDRYQQDDYNRNQDRGQQDRYQQDRYQQDQYRQGQQRFEQDRYSQDRYSQDRFQYDEAPQPPYLDSQAMEGSLSPYLAGKLILMNKQCIALSREAAQNANSPQVKQFARMTVEEHQKLMRELNQMVDSSFRQHLTLVDRDEERRTSYFRGEPGTQQEHADAERMRNHSGAIQGSQGEQINRQSDRSESSLQSDRLNQSEVESEAQIEDQSQDQSADENRGTEDASQENASQNDRPEGARELNEELNQDSNQQLNRNSAEEQDQNEGQDENVIESSDLGVSFQTDQDDETEQSDQGEQADQDRQNAQANQPNRNQAQQNGNQGLEFQDNENAERFEDREYNQEEMGDEIRRNEFRNYSEEASHSVRRPYSREEGSRDQARWEEGRWEQDRRQQDRWSQQDSQRWGSQSSSVVSKLIQMESEAAKQQIEMAKQMLREQSGQDYDMAFLGMTIGSHTHMIAHLEAMQDVDSRQLSEVVREAKAMAEDHLAYAKHLSKQLEDQEYRDSSQARDQQQGQIERNSQIQRRGETRVRGERNNATQRRGVIQGRSATEGAATIEAGVPRSTGSTEVRSEPFGGAAQGADNRAQKQEREPGQNQN